MHLTTERLSVGNMRLSVAGDGQRWVAKVVDRDGILKLSVGV